MTSPTRALCLLLALLALALEAPARAGETLDKGLLELDWFGPGVEFRHADDIDYLWVKPGFDLRGKKLQLGPWLEPQLLGNRGRDSKDESRAVALTQQIPAQLARVLKKELRKVCDVGLDEGDVLVVGRFVDVNRGSVAASFWIGYGAGSGSATWDMKFLDRRTGELLAALHHRAITGPDIAGITSDILDWAEELAENLEEGLERAYRKGKPAPR